MIIKMSLKKRITASITAAALTAASVLTLSGCSQSVSRAMTVNGEDIPAGIYILYSGHAYADATQKLKEEQPDLDTSADGFDYYNQTVDGISFADYVKRETENYCKRHTAVNDVFSDLGIEFDEETRDEANDVWQAQWDFDVSSYSSSTAFSYLKGANTLGDYLESIGVSKSSFRDYMINTYRASEIFEHYYSEGGTEEVPKDDIRKWIDENYSLTRYFSISLKDSEGNLIEDEAELKKLEDLANEYKDKLSDGGSFAEVYAAHQKYLKEQSGEEDTSESSDSTDEKDDKDYNSLIAKTSTSPSEEFVEALFKQEKNTITVFKTDAYYYVVQRLDVLETEGADGEDETDYVKNYTKTALQELKGDDMENVFKDKYSSYVSEVNDSAPDYAREQAQNALNGLTTITQIQYQNYYSQLFNYGG